MTCYNHLSEDERVVIEKLHFQLGAGGGTWTWGNPGRYTCDEVMQP